jgi:serine/threonine-protein kinase
MGTLYLAVDTNLDRTVVVKVPHVSLLATPGILDRFQREIDGLIRLEHRCILPILARGVEEGIPYYVAPYLKGGNLVDYRERHGGRLTFDQVFGWLPDIAKTLDYVHAMGVVHRDVKPSNVLFDGNRHVFLSDFGIAKVLSSTPSAGLTQSGFGPGSPTYMAPEQDTGGKVSAAADQYSLAVIVYECLGGRPPFDGDTSVTVLLKKHRDPVPPLRRFAPEVPEGAESAVMRALSKEANLRYESCTRFVRSFYAAIKRTYGSLKPGRDRSRTRGHFHPEPRRRTDDPTTDTRPGMSP